MADRARLGNGGFVMSMSSFARDIAARLHHRASLFERGYTNLGADLREIALVDPANMKTDFAARQLDILSSYGFEPVESNKPFAYSDGVAIIPIHGMLINRMSWSYSFSTGYNFIRSQMMAAMADPDVKIVVYDVNSQGGMASGCAELAQEIFDSRAVKPSLAVVDALCYSAAYFLASATNKVVVTPSGGVGSIGCLVLHTDLSGMLEAEGIKITPIFAGDEKVDGFPFQSLSSRARASIQRNVDYHYGLFTEAVARHRDLSEEIVRDTQAASFLPPEALDIGLIDAVETPAEAVANFFNDLTSDADAEDDTMQTNQGGVGTAAAVAAAAAAATPATAPAAAAPAGAMFTEAQVKAMATQAVTEALAADKARSAGIRLSEEAKGRETLAAHLADNTALSVDEARAVLAAAPKAVAASASDTSKTQPANGFAAAMDKTLNPEVGADGNTGDAGAGGGQAPTPEATGSRLLQNYSAVTGRKIPADRAAA